jgi:hypothetical protein
MLIGIQDGAIWECLSINPSKTISMAMIGTGLEARHRHE